jgi:CMP-N-acetylneuraminic acid synthetase
MVLEHSIKKLFSLGYIFEIFVFRDCTVPFISNKSIIGAIKLLNRKKCGLVMGVYNQHLNPYYNILEKDSKGFLKVCKKPKKILRSRQEAPTVYQGNGLFVYDVKKFLQSNITSGNHQAKAIPYEIPNETGLMIDTEFEFNLAKLMIENNFFK